MIRLFPQHTNVEKKSPRSTTCRDQRSDTDKEQHQRCGGSNAVSIPPIRAGARASFADFNLVLYAFAKTSQGFNLFCNTRALQYYSFV
jgi:hypothetical protein